MTEREVESREPLEWTDEPAPRARVGDAREWRVWNEDDGSKSLTVSDLPPVTGEFLQQHALLAVDLTEGEAKALAQRIENVLDPPECEHDHLAILLESGCEFNHCPFCGQLLEGSSDA